MRFMALAVDWVFFVLPSLPFGGSNKKATSNTKTL
jgi:hypothetical protein